MKKNKHRILVFTLVFYQIFCMIHIPLKLIPDNQKDAQASNATHYTVQHEHIQNQNQHLDSEEKVCNIAFFFCKSIFFFAIVKFVFEVTKVHVYIWQLPRANICGIIR